MSNESEVEIDTAVAEFNDTTEDQSKAVGDILAMLHDTDANEKLIELIESAIRERDALIRQLQSHLVESTREVSRAVEMFSAINGASAEIASQLGFTATTDDNIATGG